jgi:hypothetical protein
MMRWDGEHVTCETRTSNLANKNVQTIQTDGLDNK